MNEVGLSVFNCSTKVVWLILYYNASPSHEHPSMIDGMKYDSASDIVLQ